MMSICRLKGRCRSYFHSTPGPRVRPVTHQSQLHTMSESNRPKVAFLGPEASYTHQVSRQFVCRLSFSAICCSQNFPKESTRHGVSHHSPTMGSTCASNCLNNSQQTMMYTVSCKITLDIVTSAFKSFTFIDTTPRQLSTPSQQTHTPSHHKPPSRMSSPQSKTAASTAASFPSKIAPTGP